MGLALAREARRLGAEVDLILGPTALKADDPGISVHPVQSAREMADRALAIFLQCDIAILAAAVADYRPAETQKEKIKSKEQEWTLRLVRNPDIAAALGERKRADQFLVGFALETQHGFQHAREKLKKKKLDLIVLNTLEDEGAGFGYDTNKVTLITARGEVRGFDLKTKQEVARDILGEIVSLSAAQTPQDAE
jgi:phosphopantothenoylcysteine decarboxylase/phosphopantothenate--cysteine ligase